jgi:hypothetical protein
MMERQARWSGLVMGFDNHMIAGSRACSTSTTRPTHPTITNQTSPHYAEALGEGQGPGVLSIRHDLSDSIHAAGQWGHCFCAGHGPPGRR